MVISLLWLIVLIPLVHLIKEYQTGNVADFSSFSFHAVKKTLLLLKVVVLQWRHIDGIDDETIYKQFQLLSLHGQDKDAHCKIKSRCLGI